MARPFRFSPPTGSADLVVRPRLQAVMAARWDRRLVTVVAGPGFGKTVLLASAVAADASTEHRRDVWLTCEPADVDGDHLLSGVIDAFGLSPSLGLSELCDAVWSQAPTDICFVFDDVHELPHGSGGAGLLDRLLTELPQNGHVVVASRDRPPFHVARLAASGDVARLDEHDLTFDEQEIAAFALARALPPDLLAASGGWPALAQLTATAGAELVLEYLWEQVLDRVGEERARLLAAFEVVGGGGDEIVTALAHRTITIAELVADVPLVARTAEGSAELHPLWGPALRTCLDEAAVSDARRRAAAVHRHAGRFGQAIELLADAEAWDDVIGVLRDAETATAQHMIPDGSFARWVGRLPREWQTRPEARLAVGFDVRTRAPMDALPLFADAAAGFRAQGDVEGELAAILQDGVVRWTAGDMVGVLGLYERVAELADQGSRGAFELAAVARGAVAHIGADSEAVLAALEGVGPALTPEWLPTIHWLRSVAHRRNGNIQRALDELDAADVLPGIGADMVQQLRLARLRTDWLAGHVDEVRARLPAIHDHYVATGNRFLATEAALELASKTAFLGEQEATQQLLAAVEPVLPDMPGQLARILHAIAATATAVGDGDDGLAADIVRDQVLSTLGRPDGWYWRDRAAIALTYVLVPETRDAWAAEQLGPAHLPGLTLGKALAATRAGDLHSIGEFEWPAVAVTRAHLPMRWVVELAAAGRAAGTPAPSELIAALGASLHPTLKALAADTDSPLGAAASAWLREVPPVPEYRLRVEVLGPLRVLRDDTPDHHPDLRRPRVRQLLSYLIVHRRARREKAAEVLWPDVADPGQSLRVTLTHLQRALQPERSRGDLPYFVTTDGTWLNLATDDRLQVDAWQLDELLDQAAHAERAGNPGAALSAYRAALPLWGGEPFADVPYDDWAGPERTRLQIRYCAGALRAAELFLAAGAAPEAIAAAEHAITADPASENAYALVARGHLAIGDPDSARRAVDRCRAALADVGGEPTTATAALAHRSG